MDNLYEESLAYHRAEPKGKFSVVPTKPMNGQKDLALAYSPGVAQPCLEIAKNPDAAYEYTNKGDLVSASAYQNVPTLDLEKNNVPTRRGLTNAVKMSPTE